MKKTTKVTKALTPAKKNTTSVAKTTTAVPAAKAEPTAVVSTPAPAPAAPAPKTAPAPVVTTITAQFDVGFGNSLYLRGEGPGLSWEKGVLMTCAPDGASWSMQLGESAKPFVFKFVINDDVWSGGDDYFAAAGTSLTVTPTFPGW